MKSKILLAVLPALLVLSACQASPKAKANNLFLEDTLAHEEVFGNVKLEERSLQPKRLDDPVEHPEANNFSIGVQSQSESTGCISFRFVAAVRFADTELDPTQAIWSRTVSYTDGNVKKALGTFPSANAYKKISNGGSAYSIDDYNDAHGLTGNNAYTHFVVYTLRNVPVDSNDYYVSTYLTLSTKEGQSGGKNLTSKAVAINASQTAKFAYDLGDNGGAFFLEGTFTSQHKIIPATKVRDSGNKAEFSDVELGLADSFVVKEFYNLELEVHGPSTFNGEVSNFDLKTNPNGEIGVNYKGTYNFYLKYEDATNKLFTKASNLKRHYYVDITSCDWFTGPEIYAFGPSVEATYFALNQIGTSYIYETADEIDPTVYNGLIVMRREAGAGTSSWWNQTVNISFEEDNGAIKNCIKFTGAGGDKDKAIEWVKHS